MKEWLSYPAFWVVFVGIIIIISTILIAVKKYKQNAGNNGIYKTNEDLEQDEVKYSTVTVNAEVVDQVCYVKTVGIKTPKTVREFVITFKTENGDFMKFNVPEEMYDGFDKNQKGILTFVDDQLYGFALLDDSDSTML